MFFWQFPIASGVSGGCGCLIKNLYDESAPHESWLRKFPLWIDYYWWEERNKKKSVQANYYTNYPLCRCGRTFCTDLAEHNNKASTTRNSNLLINLELFSLVGRVGDSTLRSYAIHMSKRGILQRSEDNKGEWPVSSLEDSNNQHDRTNCVARNHSLSRG